MPAPTHIGSYTAPAWKISRRAFCRVRRQWCIVTSFTRGRMPWTHGQSLGGNEVYGTIVNAELE